MVVEWGRKVEANSLGRDNGRKGDFLTGMLMVLSNVSKIGGAAKRPKATLPRHCTLRKTFSSQVITGLWITFDSLQMSESRTFLIAICRLGILEVVLTTCPAIMLSVHFCTCCQARTVS